MKLTSHLITPVFRVMITVLLFGASTGKLHARSYASELTNTAGVVSFTLNAAADNVKVVFGTTTNDLGALAAGSYSTNVSASGVVKVEVTKSNPVGWSNTPSAFVASKLQISSDSNPFTRYNSPRGVAVNRNPSSPFFGRVYVANSTPGATVAAHNTGRGLYTMKADLSDSPNNYGTNAQAGGLPFAVSANAPFQISMGEDGYIYIADFSDASGMVARIDGNLTNGQLVADYIGGTGVTAPPNNHGSTKYVRATGSLEGGNLKVYTLDEDYVGDIGAGATHTANSIWRYDIDSGPLTNQSFPTYITQPSPSWTANGNETFVIGTNGYIYAQQNRSSAVEPGMYIMDLATGNQITNSRTMWNYLSGNLPSLTETNDHIRNVVAMALSPDQKTLALMCAAAPYLMPGATASDTYLIPIGADGIFDITQRRSLDTGAVSQGRGVDFDAVGNIYTVSSGDAILRVFSPGGTATVTTGTDGSLTVTVPPAIVSVTNTVATASEGGADGVITFTRVGDATEPLTVNYGVTGTATNGTDYTTLPGSVTFLPNETSTNIFVTATDDSDVEASETAIVSLAAGAGYGYGTPVSATVTILDNETPVITISVTQSNMVESATDSKAGFRLTRRGSLASSTAVNIIYSGVAASGVDFTGPSTVTFSASAVTTNFNVNSINDTNIEPVETFTVTVDTGGGYNVGSPSTASGAVISEDIAGGAVEGFRDNFDTDTSANWTVNLSPELDADYVFGVDYGTTLGIPEAPDSPAGSTATHGLKLRAHLTTTATTGFTPGISVSPAGGVFLGDHRLRFDLWMNFGGPLATGVAGSTEHFSAGIGVSGIDPKWPAGSSTDGIWFTGSTDGDATDTATTTCDYGVFVGSTLQNATNGYYAAGTNVTSRGNGDVYYTLWGNVTAPAAQLSLFPAQTGTQRVGALGMAWHAVVIEKRGDNVTWNIDGYRVATVPIASSGATIGQNIFLGFHDWFSSANGAPTTEFAMYDNVRVEVFMSIIGITTVNAGADIQIDFTSAPNDTTASFALQSCATVDGTYADVGATFTVVSPGVFRATRAVSNPAAFYRIRHL